MDYTAIGAALITGLLSIASIALFLKNNMPGVIKWVVLAKDAVETLNDISVALNPDPTTGIVELTTEEVTKIKSDAAKFKTDLALALGK